jgi:hypothetical protein
VVGCVLTLGLIALAVFAAAAGQAGAALIPVGLLVVVALLVVDAGKRRRRTLCRRCGRGQMRVAGREVAREERAYGLVTRTSRSFVRGWGQAGRPVGGWATERWEERVPVVRTTYRVTTRCDGCGAEETREEVEEEEDFGRT